VVGADKLAGIVDKPLVAAEAACNEEASNVEAHDNILVGDVFLSIRIRFRVDLKPYLKPKAVNFP